MKPRGFRPSIPRRNAHQDVFHIRLRVFHEHVEVAILVENSGINELVLWLLSRTFSALSHELLVGIRSLGILVEVFQIAARGKSVEVVVILLHILAVIAFLIRKAEQPLFQYRVLFIPQREREANMLMTIADARDAVFTPAIRSRTSVVMGEVIPSVSARAV